MAKTEFEDDLRQTKQLLDSYIMIQLSMLINSNLDMMIAEVNMDAGISKEFEVDTNEFEVDMQHKDASDATAIDGD
eukprot:4492599-Amphidinium_carterae.1